MTNALLESPTAIDAPQETTAPDVLPTRTIVVSETAGIAEMVARSLGLDPSLEVTFKTCALEALADEDGFDIANVDLIVFDIRAGSDGDMTALRTFGDTGSADLKFLGVTAETLSLATARGLMDAGVDEVIPLSSVSPQKEHAAPLEPVTEIAQDRRGGDVRNGTIIAVNGARGGIGATTFALNLATQLRKPVKGDTSALPKVAILDLDIQNGVLGASIDITESGSYIDWLQGKDIAPDTLITDSMMPYAAAGFDVMAAPVAFAPLDSLSPDMLATLLDDLRLTYDYVILDLPRAVVEWIDAVLTRADRFVILGDSNVHTVRQMRRLIDTFTDDHPSLPMDIIIAKEKKSRTSTAALKEAESFLDRKFTHWIPRDDAAAMKAADEGRPILCTRPRSPIAKAMAPFVTALRATHANPSRRKA